MRFEEDEQEEFLRIVGSIERADRLQQLWNISHPHGTEYDKLRGTYISREEDFRRRAKKEGYTDREIEAFLSL